MVSAILRVCDLLRELEAPRAQVRTGTLRPTGRQDLYAYCLPAALDPLDYEACSGYTVAACSNFKDNCAIWCTFLAKKKRAISRQPYRRVIVVALIMSYKIKICVSTNTTVFTPITQSISTGEYFLQFDKVRGPETCDLLSPESANIESGETQVRRNGQDLIQRRRRIHQCCILGSSQT